MHVLILPSWYPNPGEHNGIFFQQQAEDLVQAGISVTMAAATVDLHQPLMGKMTESIERGVRVFRWYRKNLTPFYEAGVQSQKYGFYSRILQKLEKEGRRPDILHMESARIARPAIRLHEQSRIPLTFSEHFSKIILSPPGSYFDQILGDAMGASSHAFYISSVVKKRMEQYDAPSAQLSYVPNSVRFANFPSSEKAKDGNTSSPFHFVALGSLVKIKGYDLLLSAMQKVHAHYPDVRLIIGGGGPEEENLRKQCADLGLEQVVTFPGKIAPADVPHFLQQASCFLCTSRFETFSVVLIEAMASGIPVIATDCGGPRDLVTPENGLLIPKEDPQQLAEAMVQMIQSREKYSPTLIRQQAGERYDSQKVAERKIQLWESLLQ